MSLGIMFKDVLNTIQGKGPVNTPTNLPKGEQLA